MRVRKDRQGRVLVKRPERERESLEEEKAEGDKGRRTASSGWARCLDKSIAVGLKWEVPVHVLHLLDSVCLL